MRMLQKKPADRYADMRELIDALEAALAKIASATRRRARPRSTAFARPTATPTDAVEELPRNKAPVYVAVAVSVAAVMVLAGVAVTHLKKHAVSTRACGRWRRRRRPSRRRRRVAPPAPAAPHDDADGGRGPGADPDCDACRRAPRCYVGAELVGPSPVDAQARPQRASRSRSRFAATASRTRSARSRSITTRRSRSSLQPKRDKVAVRARPGRRRTPQPPSRRAAGAAASRDRSAEPVRVVDSSYIGTPPSATVGRKAAKSRGRVSPFGCDRGQKRATLRTLPPYGGASLGLRTSGERRLAEIESATTASSRARRSLACRARRSRPPAARDCHRFAAAHHADAGAAALQRHHGGAGHGDVDPAPHRRASRAGRGRRQSAAANAPAPAPPVAAGNSDPYIGTHHRRALPVIRKLGEGGMGVVYLAEHVVIEKQVALKVLPEDFARKADLVARFMQEAKAASRIGHENIVDITDFGETATGAVFFVMEFLDGMDLAGHIKSGGAMPFARAQLHREPDLPRARRRARQGHHPPRHEAGERLPRDARGAGRLRQGARLRHRQDVGARRGRLAPDAHRHDLRHARVHVARAGARATSPTTASTSTRRLHPVRDADRRRAVPRRDVHGRADQAHVRGAGAAVAARAARRTSRPTSRRSA